VQTLVQQKKVSSLAVARPVLSRAQRLAPLLASSNILWGDDGPENNVVERKVLRSFGVNFVLARSTEEAVKLFQCHDFDMVISDMSRHTGVLPLQGHSVCIFDRVFA
jgi:PleD family two-component response regulator